MNAPPELSQIGLDAGRFKRSDDHSWRGPCPRCGGTRRCVVFTERSWPHWWVNCSECGLDGWADTIAPNVRSVADEEYRREREEAERIRKAARDAERRRRLAEFTTGEIWDEFHERMGYEHRRWWEEQGVPPSWQAYLKLGYTPDKPYRAADDTIAHSPAYTIPFFHYSPAAPQFRTLQFRLFDPPTPGDRYRFAPGLGTTWYDTTPTNPLRARVVVCEGAKKSMVVRVRAGLTTDDYSVLAVPSKSDIYSIAGAVKDCEVVYLWLDPDAIGRAEKLAERVQGGRARVRIVDCPVKADDAILKCGLDAGGVARLLRDARLA